MQKAPREMRLLVNMLMLVNVIMLMVKVMKVKEFVVEALLLFSLSSTPTPTTNLRTRPAARVWAWPAKGSGFECPREGGTCLQGRQARQHPCPR